MTFDPPAPERGGGSKVIRECAEGGKARVEKMSSKRSGLSRGQVNAFNLVPVVEQVLPDRPKAEVGSSLRRSR